MPKTRPAGMKPGESFNGYYRRRRVELEMVREQPLPAPFQHRDGNWWSGVIDDYIAATKRDKIDRTGD